MSDVKTDYSEEARNRKIEATRDEMVADLIQQGYIRKNQYGEFWEEVDLNDIISALASDYIKEVVGAKVIYYSSSNKIAVVCDVSGYLRIEDLSVNYRKRRYLDKNGNDIHNYVDSDGKIRGRSRNEFQRMTHYRIKKRKDM